MPPRVLCTALVTLNVFQNSLARHDPCWRYYANLLSRLLSQPVGWYMSELDFDMAYACFNLFGGDINETCQEAYLEMLNRVQVCSITDGVLEESGRYQLNFCDGLRLACAIDWNVDAIVTWEPGQFARSVEEHYQLQIDRYFYLALPTECIDLTIPLEMRVGVFSVETFLLNLHEIAACQLLPTQRFQPFHLEEWRLVSADTGNEATIRLKVLDDNYLQATARGNSTFDALQKAMDQLVDQCVQIPPRSLRRYFITPATLSGADAPVEVVICVECGEHSFERSACSGNIIQAMAKAYIKVINAICEWLRVPIISPQLDSRGDRA